MLVLVEILVLLAGVVARFVFHAPLVWSDELASILFLWLAMLGSVVALRRGEHMRMTALVGHARRRGAGPVSRRSPPAPALPSCRWSAWPACEYAARRVLRHDAGARACRNAWRAAALPIGIGLMAVFAVLRLLRRAEPRHAALALVVVVAIVPAFWLAAPLFRASGT